uniref:Uncharacterized protein n=1 Tax=viral metagenome TaxID=1070528 RepID=A0A6C0HTJ0_9ZZZZ
MNAVVVCLNEIIVKVERKEKRRLYYQKNKETIIVRQKEYYENNKEKRTEYQIRYQNGKQEELQNYNKNYYQKNKERLKSKRLNIVAGGHHDNHGTKSP